MLGGVFIVSIGGVIGFCLGWIFVMVLNSFIKGISYRKEAKRLRKGYFDVLSAHNKCKVYVKVCQKLGLTWLMTSKLVTVIIYILKILIMLFCIAACVALVIMNSKGYEEFFNMRW